MKVSLVKLWATTVLTALVVGCASLGVPTPTTFGERVIAAQVANTEIVRTVGVLYTAKQISKEDANNILEQSVNAQAGVALAAGMVGTDTSAGEDKLRAVQATLTGLQAYLANRSKPK